MKLGLRVRYPNPKYDVIDFSSAQETLIQELTSQLAQVKALSGTGQSYMVQFLTREAADEEKKSLDKEVTRLKDKLKQKDANLAEKDKRIAELEAQGQLYPP